VGLIKAPNFYPPFKSAQKNPPEKKVVVVLPLDATGGERERRRYYHSLSPTLAQRAGVFHKNGRDTPRW